MQKTEETFATSDFTPNDYKLITGWLSVLFLLAPLFPQNIYASYAFLFRSTFFLLTALVAYRLGAEKWIARLRGMPLLAPFLVYFLILSGGLFYTPDLYLAKQKLINVFSLFLFFSFMLTGPLSDRIRTILLMSLLAGGILAAIHGLSSQWMGHAEEIRVLQESTTYPDDMRTEMIRALEANRALGRFGNPNQLAGILVLSLWPIWWLWKKEEKWISRIFLGFGTLLLTVGIYRTYSRSGLIALLLSLVLCLGFELYSRGYRLSWKTVIGIAGFLFMILVIGILLLPSGFLGGRLLTISTLVARFHFYRGAALIITHFPWLGVGPEGFEQYYCAFIRPGDLEAHYVHNVILESAVEGGVLGTLAFFWMVNSVWTSFLRMGTRCREMRIDLLAAGGACSTLLFFSLVDFHNNLTDMWLIPVAMLGIVHRPFVVSIRCPHSRRIAPVLLLGLAIAWGGWVLCRYWNENARSDGHALILTTRKYEAREAYERAVLFDRTDAESWRQLGYLWAEIPTPAAQQRRMESMKKALDWAPCRASIHADYADALFALGYIEPALEEIHTAQRLFPARPIYYERAAAMYRFMNRNEEAEMQNQKANQLKKAIEANRP